MANFKGREPVQGSMGTISPLYNIELRSKDGSPVAPEKSERYVLFLQLTEASRLESSAGILITTSSMIMYGEVEFTIRATSHITMKTGFTGSTAALTI